MAAVNRDRDQLLAAVLIELVASSPEALARLVELLEAHRPAGPQATAPAYTVASLAAALKVSPRAIRGAIARGELAAAKRGGRWIIAAGAVEAWAQEDVTLTVSRRRRSPVDRPLGSAIALLPGANGRRRLL